MEVFSHDSYGKAWRIYFLSWSAYCCQRASLVPIKQSRVPTLAARCYQCAMSTSVEVWGLYQKERMGGQQHSASFGERPSRLIQLKAQYKTLPAVIAWRPSLLSWCRSLVMHERICLLRGSRNTKSTTEGLVHDFLEVPHLKHTIRLR